MKKYPPKTAVKGRGFLKKSEKAKDSGSLKKNVKENKVNIVSASKSAKGPKPKKKIVKVSKELDAALEKARSQAKEEAAERMLAFKDNSSELFLNNVPEKSDKKDVMRGLNIRGKDIKSIRFRGEIFNPKIKSKKVQAILNDLSTDEHVPEKFAYVVFVTKEVLGLWMEEHRQGQAAVYIGNNRISYSPSVQGNKFSVFSPKKTICIKGLGDLTSSNDVWDTFADLKPVRVRMMREEGKNTGTGFVEFPDRATVNELVKKKNRPLCDGQRIKIEKVKSEDEAFMDKKKVIAERMMREQKKISNARKKKKVGADGKKLRSSEGRNAKNKASTKKVVIKP